MLTRQDQTVVDCLEVFEAIRGRGPDHVGFKDVGVDLDSLRRLNAAHQGRPARPATWRWWHLARGHAALGAGRAASSASTG